MDKSNRHWAVELLVCRVTEVMVPKYESEGQYVQASPRFLPIPPCFFHAQEICFGSGLFQATTGFERFNQ